MSAAFIDDGYTLNGYIAADADLDIEAIEFTYRPSTARHNTLWQHQSERASPEDKAARDEQFMADHIASWSLKRRNGTAVEITKDNCGKVNPVVSIRLINIISGWSKSDPRPDGTVPEAVNAEAAKGN